MIYIYGIVAYLLGIAVGFYIGKEFPKKIEYQQELCKDDQLELMRAEHNVPAELQWTEKQLAERNDEVSDLGATSGCWNPNICMDCNDMCPDVENRNCKKQRRQGNHNYPPDLR